MRLARSTLPELFLAHAGADSDAAERLFDLLAPDVRAWLDTRCLLPGDEWPKEIARAQGAALATVILLSRNAEHAYYLTDEIHTAIALHRRLPDEHRAVAVFLDGRPDDPMQVPVGLRSLHSLDAVAEGGLDGVARKLKALVATLRERSAPPAPPLAPGPSSAGAKPIERFSSASASREPAGAMPARADVRALLAKVLRTDGDLDAFCGDYFPEVYARFAGGMDRVGKVNLFLDYADSSLILDKLRQAHPDAVQAHIGVPERRQENAGRPSPSYPDGA
jgi:hypothetical protein